MLAVVVFVVGIAARPLRSIAASLGVLLLVFGAVSIGVAAARGIGRDDFGEALPTDLTVVVWNTEGGAPGAEAIAALAVEEGAEIVSLPETSAETATAVADSMAVAGLPMTVKTVEYPAQGGSEPTSLLIAAALGEYTVALAEDGTAVETTPLSDLDAELLEIDVGPRSRISGVRVFELLLPVGANVALVVRDGRSFVPRDTDVLRHGDQLLVVCGRGLRRDVERRLRAVSRDGRLAGWHRS